MLGVRLLRVVALASSTPGRIDFLRRTAACVASAGVNDEGRVVQVSVHFERAVRPYLNAPGRKLEVALPARSNGCISALYEAMAPWMSADPSLFRLLHGKRNITSDQDLRGLVAIATERNIATQLRLAEPLEPQLLPPAPAPALTSAPAPAWPPGEALQMISFFTFHAAPAAEAHVTSLVEGIERVLADVEALGSVYVASEGVNAQVAVPVSQLGRLREGLEVAGLGDVELNCGELVEASEPPPFKKRVVKVRRQILTDGLARPLDWQRAGEDVPPEEWEAALQTEGALLLDCRNAYESEAGTFVLERRANSEGDGPRRGAAAAQQAAPLGEDEALPAEPLGTETFAQSWDVLRERLADVPKDAPILTYCTGGIRCVKVNAFLEQELGFHNTKKLQHGIVGYLRHKREQRRELSADASEAQVAASSPRTAWRGANFVFDRRTLVAGEEDAGAEGAGEHEEGAVGRQSEQGGAA